EQEVLKSNLPVLVDFWAPWCAPCRIVSPIVEELAKEYNGKLQVFKLNVDDNPQTASKYGIMSIPSLLIFKKGQVLTALRSPAKIFLDTQFACRPAKILQAPCAFFIFTLYF
ncbi:MAG: thioredoxin, partial [Candidatus Levybacteria bacterium]|nr:thioredoxin [Candidatus Levybacteria bacterium]